ncbi:MAG: cbb3-type cytochrome c oxidase subunit I [Candidatus Thiodiazotropha sp.]
MISFESSGFSLQTSRLSRQTQVLRWLQLGVLALALAGLFAILLVLSRIPGSEAFFGWIDFFKTALVIHVDQSVLIWFLSMSALIWSLTIPHRSGLQTLESIAFLFALSGALGIAASAFIGDGAPLMNNYVPVLQRPLFFLMLGLFGIGITLQASVRLVSFKPKQWLGSSPDILNLASWTVSLALLVSLLALLVAWTQMPDDVTGQAYYEYLFWGAGHSLQFAYTQLIILVWILLALGSGVVLPGNPRWYLWLFVIGVAPVLVTPLIYMVHETVTLASRSAFTDLMKYGGGLAVIPVGLLIVIGLLWADQTTAEQKPLRAALWMSLLLFFSGGALALFITGVNTMIPAHYHGSIVGVTLGLMGLGYLLLPKLGYPIPKGRMVKLQPWIYGIGQLLHISGLAGSGLMGIQRKTAGSAQGLESIWAKAFMGVMGLGGLLAVIGGILFVWIMLRTFVRGR